MLDNRPVTKIKKETIQQTKENKLSIDKNTLKKYYL
jgi:hypothetical protein